MTELNKLIYAREKLDRDKIGLPQGKSYKEKKTKQNET